MVNRERQRAARTARFGERLSEWRARRRESQLSLALGANVSQRHLSFIESGRAQPSREMVVRLCDALEIPLRARNELLMCAGYAALYPERSLESSEMQSVREALRRIVEHHEPCSSWIANGGLSSATKPRPVSCRPASTRGPSERFRRTARSISCA